MATATDVEVAEIVPENEAVEEAASNNAVGATDVSKAIAGLNNPEANFYTSIKAGDFDTRLSIAAALTDSTPVDDVLGQTINIKDVIILPVELLNQQTGETNTAPRVILIDDDGKAYNATSIGLLTAIRNLFSVLGEPGSWAKPVAARVVEQKGNNGFKFFTLKFAPAAS